MLRRLLAFFSAASQHPQTSSLPMVEITWTTRYCLGEPGFPQILATTLTKLGITERQEYVGKEYEEVGIDRYRVTIS